MDNAYLRGSQDFEADDPETVLNDVSLASNCANNLDSGTWYAIGEERSICLSFHELNGIETENHPRKDMPRGKDI